MKILLLAALLACLPASRAAAQPRRIAFVLDSDDASERVLLQRLAKTYAARATVSVYEFDDDRMTDPIAKGRLLAELETRDLVVAVGNGATEFTSRELEDVPVYFVDASLVDGRRLASPTLAGLFAYSVDGLLDAAKALRLGTIGVAFTPGYEPVAAWIRAGAAARGMDVIEKRIAATKELAPAVRSLLDRARAIWIVGDPLLARGAGFDYIRERTLSLDVPLVTAGEWGVRRGALLGYASNSDTQATAAERSIDQMLRRDRDGRRLSPSSPGGTILLNATLARKWAFSPPPRAGWQLLQ